MEGRMTDVRLRPVSYSELSSLQHEVAVADAPPHQAPEFLVIRYFGSYRDGGEGEPDARYILAAAAAAREAWWSYSTILDFRELEYRWGDNMSWVLRIAWDPGIRLHWPLAIVVSDKCRDALRSLLREEYERSCVESLPEAFALCRQKAQAHKQHLQEKRGQDGQPAAADKSDREEN
jgi:hypothetical protein